MKRILLLLTVLLVGVGIALSVRHHNPSPTAEERKQMNILDGQLFVFDGITNEIKRTRTITAFDEQHEMVRYLRVVSFIVAENNWPHDRPLRVTDLGDEIQVIWPLPPDIENKPIRWGADWVYAALVDKHELKLLDYCLGN